MHNFTVIPLRSGAKGSSPPRTPVGPRSSTWTCSWPARASKRPRSATPPPHGGNAWSSSWHNGHIYANNIVRGLDVSLPSDSERGSALKLDHLNPQTQINTVG
jgi:hypothetical protein